MHIDGITTELADVVTAAHDRNLPHLATLLGKRIHDDASAGTFIAEISALAARPGRDSRTPQIVMIAGGDPEPMECALELLEVQSRGETANANAMICAILDDGERLFAYEVIFRLVAISGELSRLGAFDPDPTAMWRGGENVLS